MDQNTSIDAASSLVCPTTKLGLLLMDRGEAEKRMGGPLFARNDLVNARGGTSKPAGVTEKVLVREDLQCAYPILNGTPVLLAPEVLTLAENSTAFDLGDPRYAEAYEEMEFYNLVAGETLHLVEAKGVEAILDREMSADEEARRSFPAPREIWIDSVHDSHAQWDAYVHLGKLKGKRLLQMGGSGAHAIKFAIAGAAETWLLTPMSGEARMARLLADSAGVGNRFRAVVGIAEEAPFANATFDGIYAGGCLHHMVTEMAFPEAARVLRRDGRFAAVEPWRAPLYSIGTKILGKREAAYCRPINAERLAPVHDAFSSIALSRHGTIARYPLIALEKFGLPISRSVPWHLGKADDAFCSLIPGLRNLGSSIAILATK